MRHPWGNSTWLRTDRPNISKSFPSLYRKHSWNLCLSRLSMVSGLPVVQYCGTIVTLVQSFCQFWGSIYRDPLYWTKFAATRDLGCPWISHLSLLHGRIPPGHDPPRSSSLDTWPSPLGSKKRKMAVQRCFSSFPTAQRHAAAGHQVGDAIKKESSKEGMGKN